MGPRRAAALRGRLITRREECHLIGRRTGGRLIALCAGALVTVVTLALLPGTPAAADPSIAEIEAQIKSTWSSLEPVIEQYNKAKSDLDAKKARKSDLEQAIKPLELQVDLAKAKVGTLAAATYKAGTPSSLRIVLSGSGSSNQLLDRLVLVNQMSRQRLGEISGVRTARDNYDKERKSLDGLIDQLTKQESELAGKRKEIESNLTNLQGLRRKVYGNGGTGPLRPTDCPFKIGTAEPGASAAAKACAQIGANYVYATAGPTTFDCSGLALFSWKGLASLPRTAADQYAKTTRVDRANLRPGDLVFYYQGVSHVAVYVGGDWVVHAPQAGDQVRMASISHAPIVGYGRPA